MRRLLFTMLLLSTACNAEEPGVAGGDEMGPDAGVADAPVEEEEGVPLQVEGLPPQTYWDTVPIYGRGPANGTLLVEANVETLSIELGSDGNFCLDVPLEEGALNVLDLVAIDASGERSDAQVFEVSQSGEPPEPGQAVAARNMVLGGLPTADSTVDAQVGAFQAMTDGNLNTSVVLQNAVFYSDWFVLRVPSPEGIEKIRVYSNPECLAGDYLVHTAPSVLAEMPQPGLLEVDAAPWTFRGHYRAAGVKVNVSDCSDGSLSCQEFNFDSAVTGAIGINFSGDSCSNTFGLGEHQFHEVEAWSPAGVAPPTITAPSCQGGF